MRVKGKNSGEYEKNWREGIEVDLIENIFCKYKVVKQNFRFKKYILISSLRIIHL